MARKTKATRKKGNQLVLQRGASNVSGFPGRVIYETEVCPGLERIAQGEIRDQLKGQAEFLPDKSISADGSVRFYYPGHPRKILELRSIIAAYRVVRFKIPRPKALLGDQNFRILLSHIDQVRQTAAEGTFRSLYISAAGSDSSVFTRLKEKLAKSLSLEIASHEGDLLLRIKRAPRSENGWEVLIRLTPRPLSARPWRIWNMPGALNASVASAMIQLTQPKPEDIFLNLASGSGTFLVERAYHGKSAILLGCDLEPSILAGSVKNIRASGATTRIQLILSDGQKLPIQDRIVSALCSDLPFGGLVGSHAENERLYPNLFKEAARVARKGALFAVISHEIRLMDRLLNAAEAWSLVESFQVNLRGLHPKIYLLKRT